MIHRDLKPENILLDKNYDPKLCDFGWSTILNGENNQRSTFCGTYEYMAPEIYESENYNSKIDIWSLGILLYEMIHGKSPFVDKSIFKIFKNMLIHKLDFKKDIDKNAKDLIIKILKLDPKERPTINEISQHPYLQDIENQKISLLQVINEQQENFNLENVSQNKDQKNTVKNNYFHEYYKQNDYDVVTTKQSRSKQKKNVSKKKIINKNKSKSK